MARLLSLPVVGGGAFLASPALWSAFVDGTMSTDTALVRWAVAAVVCWLGLSLVRFLVEGTSPPVRRTGAVAAAVPDERHAEAAQASGS